MCLLTAAATALPLSTASAAASRRTRSSPPSVTPSTPSARTLDTRAVEGPSSRPPRRDRCVRAARQGRQRHPRHVGRALRHAALGARRRLPDRGRPRGAAVDVARGWLRAHAAAFGLTTAQVDSLAVVRDHALPSTGTHVVDFVQTADGVAAARGGRLNVAVTKDGRVLSYAGDPTPGANLTGGWVLGEAAALLKVAGGARPRHRPTPPRRAAPRPATPPTRRGPFGGPSYVKKVTFGDQGRPRRGVQGLLHQEPAGGVGGRRRRHHRLDPLPHQRRAVRRRPAGHRLRQLPRRGQGRPAAAAVVRAHGRVAQGLGRPHRVPGTGVTTYGNNADTYANWSNYIGPVDNAPRPVAPTGNFSYTYTNEWAATKGQAVPPSYAAGPQPRRDQPVLPAQPDPRRVLRLGFTETAGNFQLDNGSNGGRAATRSAGWSRPAPPRAATRPTPAATTPTCSPSTTGSRRGAACSCGSPSTTRSRAPTATARST